MRKAIAVALVGGMLLAAAPASARIIVVDRDRAHGDYATANAIGSVNDPKAVFVKVKSDPTDKRVRVIWNVTCSRPSGQSATGGDFYRRTTVYEQLRMPFANPDICRYSATVQLTAGSARLTVVLLARV